MTILNDDDSANAELKRTMDVNFMGAVYCTREAYKSMMKRDAYGYIININSIDGHYVSENEVGEGKILIRHAAVERLLPSYGRNVEHPQPERADVRAHKLS